MGSPQIMFQMYKMIQLDRPRVTPAIPQDGKFGMAAVEPCDFGGELGRSSDCVQVRVALRASDVRRDCKAQMAAVLQVARRAYRSESLVGVMKRSAMAGVARLVGGFRAERIRFLHVARAAFRCQYGMGRGHFSSAVNAIVAAKRIPAQPNQRDQRNSNR